MKDIKNKSIIFHVVFDKELICNLKKIASKQKLSFSGTVNFILQKYEHILNEVECGEVVLNEERDDILISHIDCHKKVRIDKRLKFLLFSFQNRFKSRSKGAVLRAVLRDFIRNADEEDGKLEEGTKKWEIKRKGIWNLKSYKTGHMSLSLECYRIERWDNNYQILQIQYLS